MDMSGVLIPIGRAAIATQGRGLSLFPFIQAQQALIECLPRYQRSNDGLEACWLFRCHDPICLSTKTYLCSSSFGAEEEKKAFDNFFSINEKTSMVIVSEIANQAAKFRKIYGSNPVQYIFYGVSKFYGTNFSIMPIHGNNKVPPYKFFIQSLPLQPLQRKT